MAVVQASNTVRNTYIRYAGVISITYTIIKFKSDYTRGRTGDNGTGQVRLQRSVL